MSPEQNEKSIEVAIAGGGMSGLCLAIGLLEHRHINVRIYEAAHCFSEIGAGVAFGPNAQRALRLISAGTEQAFLRLVTHNAWEECKNTWFEWRWGYGQNEGELITAPKNETGQASLHRAKFLDELVKLVPKDIAHFDKRLVRLEELKSGRVRLHFQDDTVAEADAVVGAEGIHSVTRRHILGEKHPASFPKYSGAIGYRGKPSILRVTGTANDFRSHSDEGSNSSTWRTVRPKFIRLGWKRCGCHDISD